MPAPWAFLRVLQMQSAGVLVRSDKRLYRRDARGSAHRLLCRSGCRMSLEPEDNSRLGIALGIAAIFILFFLLFAWFVEWI